jgi:hypothetical protein
MGREEQRVLLDVTENQQEDDSIAAQKTQKVLAKPALIYIVSL